MELGFFLGFVDLLEAQNQNRKLEESNKAKDNVRDVQCIKNSSGQQD